jgi:hypothetical protein
VFRISSQRLIIGGSRRSLDPAPLTIVISRRAPPTVSAESVFALRGASSTEIVDGNFVPKLDFFRYCLVKHGIVVELDYSSPEDGADRWSVLLLSAQIAAQGRLGP